MRTKKDNWEKRAAISRDFPHHSYVGASDISW